MILRPDRHKVDGPVFSVLAHGNVQAFVPYPNVEASFQLTGGDRLDGPVLAGPHKHAAICRVWANGPIAVLPVSGRTLIEHGLSLSSLTQRLTKMSPALVGQLSGRKGRGVALLSDQRAGDDWLSRRQRQRRFLAATGLTMCASRRLERLVAARVDVLAGAMSLAEIAAEHGFSDQAHFTSVYRLWSGVTPGMDRARGSADVVFLQDGRGWSPLPDSMIEGGETWFTGSVASYSESAS